MCWLETVKWDDLFVALRLFSKTAKLGSCLKPQIVHHQVVAVTCIWVPADKDMSAGGYDFPEMELSGCVMCCWYRQSGMVWHNWET